MARPCLLIFLFVYLLSWFLSKLIFRWDLMYEDGCLLGCSIMEFGRHGLFITLMMEAVCSDIVQYLPDYTLLRQRGQPWECETLRGEVDRLSVWYYCDELHVDCYKFIPCCILLNSAVHLCFLFELQKLIFSVDLTFCINWN